MIIVCLLLRDCRLANSWASSHLPWKSLSVTTTQSVSSYRNVLLWFFFLFKTRGRIATSLSAWRQVCKSLYSGQSLWSLIRDIGVCVCVCVWPHLWSLASDVMCVCVCVRKESDMVRVPPASYRLRWEQPGGARSCLCATVTGCDGWPLGISALEVLNERSRAITLFLCVCACVCVCVSWACTHLYIYLYIYIYIW